MLPSIFGEFVFSARHETPGERVCLVHGLGPLKLVVEQPADAVDLAAVDELVFAIVVVIRKFKTEKNYVMFYGYLYNYNVLKIL